MFDLTYFLNMSNYFWLKKKENDEKVFVILNEDNMNINIIAFFLLSIINIKSVKIIGWL